MGLTIRREAGVELFSFEGPVTIAHGELLQKAFLKSIDDGGRRFVFNFTESSYMDSASIGQTIACLKRVKQSGGELKLVVARDGTIRKMLEFAALNQVFQLFDREQDAIDDF